MCFSGTTGSDSQEGIIMWYGFDVPSHRVYVFSSRVFLLLCCVNVSRREVHRKLDCLVPCLALLILRLFLFCVFDDDSTK